MSNILSRHQALTQVYQQSDTGFFADHADRKAHIRRAFRGECDGEFWSLGPHDSKRRRIILWRVPAENPAFAELKKQQGGEPLLKIPFLQFGDETLEDRDDILLPIVHEVMLQAAARMQ